MRSCRIFFIINSPSKNNNSGVARTNSRTFLERTINLVNTNCNDINMKIASAPAITDTSFRITVEATNDPIATVTIQSKLFI